MPFRAAGLACWGFVLALTAGVPASAERENPFEHLVDIGGGRHLNMICTGKGSPTIVFMQGLGSDITDWRKVKEPVAAFSRACFYDRAGFGYSDPSGKPATAENVADDLHALLRAAEIDRPVVLVGHSLGGLFATFYADKFASDVAGLVLVDPSFAGQFDYKVSAQDRKGMRPPVDRWIAQMQACKMLAEDGKLSRSDHACIPPSQVLKGQGLAPGGAEYVTQQFFRPTYYASILSEFKNLDPILSGSSVDAVEERQHQHSFGNLPLEVLTAGRTYSDAPVSETAKKAMSDVWKHGHDKLALRSTRGESIVVSKSNHFIQLDQPEQVIEAIRKVVLEARQ